MSFTVTGFFALANGRQEVLTSSNNKQTTYCTYDSSFTCSDSTSCPIIIRHFSPQHTLSSDNTIVFLIAKAGFPTTITNAIVFQALYFFPLPGLPSSEDYENSAPEMLHPVASIIGHVTTPLSPSMDLPRRFTMLTSSYISTGNVTSTVTCVSIFPTYKTLHDFF